MIYYFSGTGNSAFVAEKLAEYTKDECRFIPEVFAQMTSDITVQAGEVIGVVCPIYAWGVPECVTDFLSHVKVENKAFAYIVATCAASAGRALRQVAQVFPYNSAYSVRMPENCTPLFKTDSNELQHEKINVARQLLPRIAAGIVSRREDYDVKEGWEAQLKTAVVHPLFASFFMRTSHFRVGEECTQCGTCESVCPFGIIKLIDGKVTWQSDRCQMCMKCLMHCPTRALRMGLSARHEVYLFQDNTAEREVIKEEGGAAFVRGATDRQNEMRGMAGEYTAVKYDTPHPHEAGGEYEDSGKATIYDESAVPFAGSAPVGRDYAIASLLADVEQLERLTAKIKRRLKVLEMRREG